MPTVPPPPVAGSAPPAADLSTIARTWGRIGCLGFGGPPVHIAMLRERVVERERWLDADEFEDAIAFCNLLPGPASSQLAILTAWRVGGRAGGLLGGLAFVLPGLVAMVVLAAVFLAGAPPDAVRGAGTGAGAVVAAVAVHAGWSLLGPSLARARGGRAFRWALYVALGVVAAATTGPWLVLVLVACGLAELGLARVRRGGGGDTRAGGGGRPGGAAGSGGVRGPGGEADTGGGPGPAGPGARGGLRLHAWPAVLPALAAVGGTGSLAWTAFKVGALSYGGGFVIIPLMRDDAVERHGWLTDARFLDVVALGQVTPGPVVHTVSGVGYAAHGVGGALLAATVAFAPSFLLILALAPRFGTLRHDRRLRAFLDGAGPAAIGAILGAAIPLALALGEPWQAALLALGAALLLAGRVGVLPLLLGAGLVGAVLAVLGAPVPA